MVVVPGRQRPVNDEQPPRPDLDAIQITNAEGTDETACAAIERGAYEPRPARCSMAVQFVRLTARAGASAVYADMTPADWHALSLWWPDLMLSLMERMTTELGLADRHDAEWEVQAFEDGDEF